MRLFTLAILAVLSFSLSAQVNYTANDQVTPYNGQFRMGMNMGYVQGWDNQTLADIAAGNQSVGQIGVGAKSVRVGLYEEPFEYYGYNLNTSDFAHYNQLGMGEFVALIGNPSPDHRDYANQYCPGEFSAFHSNMYLPIWDNGANGTPYNDDNYLAAYLYKTAEIYKDDVRFWEIWNEPGFDLRSDIGGIGWRDITYPGNWWLEGPPPCDNILQAPIYSYIRVMRIAWEVIKTVDPDSYVCLGSVGYQSFLNAMLRNTDNPNAGDISPDFPLTAGAYFDCITYHSYPHFDGSTTNFDQQIFERHSDGAADGVVWYRDFYQEILDLYGYDGITYPKKEWIITEINSPRVDYQSFGFPFFAGQDAQINHMMKAYMISKINKIHSMQVFSLIDRQTQANATYEFDLMGMYQPLDSTGPYNNVMMNDEGKCMLTTSKLLYDTEYDDAKSQAMNLPAGARGYAFKRQDGSYIYAVWTRTMTDLSENAFATYSFPASFNMPNVTKYEWNWGTTNMTNNVASQNIFLNARPVFFTDANLPPTCALSAFTNNVICDDNGTPSNPNDDTFTFDLTVNGSNASAGWTAMVNGQTITGTYGTATTLGPYPISGGNISFNISDQTTTSCVTETFAAAPAPCSTSNGPNVCASASMFPWHDWIAGVEVATLNNASSKAMYTDYTSQSTDLATGQSYALSLTSGYSWFTFNHYYRVWIDFDKNGTFSPSEQVYEGILNAPPNGAANGTLNGILAIPSTADLGATVMRVSMQRDAYADPCGDFQNGEVEDYGVNITQGSNGGTCFISASVSDISCSNNGTPNDVNDDTYTYSMTVIGNNTGSGWTTTVNGQAITGNYGIPLVFGPYPIAGGDISMDIQDAASATCMASATALAPATCSNGGTGNYCGSTSDFPWHEWISEVTIGTFTNASGKSAYSDFTSQSITMAQGANVNLVLTTGFSWETFEEAWSLWIDYNQDGIFDASELAFQKMQANPGNGTLSASSTGSFTVPMTAELGNTRMRVSMKRGSAADACETVPEGEVEDYTVTIAPMLLMNPELTHSDDALFLEAQVYGSSVQLSWESTQPEHVVRFYVEKATNDGDWKRIATLPLASAGVHQYLDFDPADGTNSYRIVSVQTDGYERTSAERNIRLQYDGFKVFPNPTAGRFTVDLSHAIGRNGTLILFSNTGQLIQRWTLENVEFSLLPIDLSSAPAGQYFLQLNVEGRAPESLKVVKR